MKPKSAIRHLLALAGSSLLAISSASAATLYWDGTDTSLNADGGAGTWSTTDAWDTSAFLGTNTTWTDGDFAVFGGTASNAVTTGAPITTSGIQFNTTGYTLTATAANSLSFTGTSNIILNNIAAATITGTIADTAANITLSTTNPNTAGTLTLNGTSTTGWSGTTTINPGMTLALAADNRALANTSGITLNGGNIILTNTNATQAGYDRINNDADITSNGGSFTWTNTATSGVQYAETLGTVDLNRGQLAFLLTNNQNGGGGNNQILTLAGLTRASDATSAVSFSFNGGANANNQIVISGSTPGFIGPWASYGLNANTTNITDYAVINASNQVVNANIAATAQDSASWTDGGGNVTLGSATTLTGNRNLNTLRATFAGTFNLGGYTLESSGVLTGQHALTISNGVLTTASGGGHLYLTPGWFNQNMTVSAAINDNAGAVTLVKSGAAALILSGTNNYSGGTVLNAGQITITSPDNIGSGGITFNGASTLRMDTANVLNFGSRAVTVNEGAAAVMTSGNGGKVFEGVLSGNGSLFLNHTTDFIFSNTDNTFSGTITSTTGIVSSYGLGMASIGDGVGAGLINLNNGSFRWLKASGGTTTFENRQFALSGTTSGGQITALGGTSAENLVINRDLLITGVGSKTFTLGGTNLGNNTFAGNISDGIDGGTSIISVNKVDAGRWILSGTNTYTGPTTISGGTLVISNTNALPENGLLIFAGGTLESTVGSGVLDQLRYAATGGTITNSMGGSNGFNKFTTGAATLNSTNSFTGGITVGAGSLSVGALATLGQNVSGNSILIRDGGILSLGAAANSGSSQAITLSSSSKSGGPVSNTGGGAGPVGRLAVLGLGFNGLPSGAISQANTNGGVIAIRGVTGYNTDLSTLLTGNNFFLGATGSNSTFTGAAGTVVAGNGNLYRLGGGGAQITFNTTNLFTGENGVQVGSTFVNGGGTVVVQAAQDYTGATTVSQGTLTLSGANGTATDSSGFTLNGGRLFLDNGTNNTNRIGNTAAVNLSNGGELHFGGNSAGTTEEFGDLNLGAGYSIVTATAAGSNASTLAGTGFSRTDNGTALFRGTSLGQSGATGRVTLSDTSGLTLVGGSTLDDAANTDTTKDVKIIPYLVGATAANGTGDTFVTYDDTLGFRVLNTTNHFNTTLTANTNVRLAAAATNIATNTVNSLIHTTGTSTIADGAILTVTSGALLINGNINQTSASGTGVLAFGVNTGFITNTGGAQIGARITGSGGLVKSGAGELQLNNINNSFTGDVILNSGTLRTSASGATATGIFGDAANKLIVNGHSIFQAGNATFDRDITLNNGSILTFAGETYTFSGDVTGTGGIQLTGGFSAQVNLTGLSNTFEGPILIAGTGTGNANYRFTVASLADSATANGRIVFSGNAVNGGTGSRFEYTGGTGGDTSLVLNNRQIELASTIIGPTAGHQIMNSSAGTGTITVATDLIVSTPIDQALSLRGANTGANTFSGKIIDGDGKVSLIKADAGRWILSGENTFSGSTVVSGGTLELANSLALQNSALDTTSSVAGNASAGLRTTQTSLTIGGLNGNKNLAATGGVFTTTSGGYDSVTALTLNPGAGVTAFYTGAIANGAAGMTLTKTGAGTQILAGTNTYTGATHVNAGTLLVNGSTHADSAVTVASGATLGGTGTVNGAVTVTGSIAPGTIGIGTLNAGGDVTWNSGDAWKFDLGSSDNSSDLLAVTGAFTRDSGSGFMFDFMGSTPLLGETFTLVTFASTNFVLADFDLAGSIATLGAGSYGNSVFIVNTTSLQFTAIPEPTTALAGLLLALGLLRRRRK